MTDLERIDAELAQVDELVKRGGWGDADKIGLLMAEADYMIEARLTKKEKQIKPYKQFLAEKFIAAKPVGFQISETTLNARMKDFQKSVTRRGIWCGRYAFFLDTGLGKTICCLEWARIVSEYNGGKKILILTPLAVAEQYVAEGVKFGIPAIYCRNQEAADNAAESIIVSNYEMLKAFDASKFIGVVLDEASILKNYMGATKRLLIETFKDTQYRLVASATPAPNDPLEIGNQCEFLGIMNSNDMISRWFINDTMQAGNYRLKRHAEKDFAQWLSTWSVWASKPSEIGFSDDGYNLLPLNIIKEIVSVDCTSGAEDGELLRNSVLSSTSMHKEMRITSEDRARRCKEIIGYSAEQWVIWCNTDYDADAITSALPQAVEVKGSMSFDLKRSILRKFAAGEVQILVTKSKITGHGMNWQNCHNTIVNGLSFSWEALYQLLRRFWRFGQQREVNAHLVIASTEGSILDVIDRKERGNQELKKLMIEVMREFQSFDGKPVLEFERTEAEGSKWRMVNDDCVLELMNLPNNSLDYSIFSPPFSNLYIYSDHPADMGNTDDDEHFIESMKYMARELYRTLRPGRLVSMHCKDLPKYKGRDGEMGLRDFPGMLIAAMEDCNFAFHSRVTIWKCPVTEMQRTKNHGLLYKNLCTDSTGSRQGMADYVVTFRKFPQDWDTDIIPVRFEKERFDRYVGLEPPDAGEVANTCGVPVPMRAENGKWPSVNPFQKGSNAYRLWSIMVWQKYASPVWFDIEQTNVLNCKFSREDRDEKHICPLQLDVIERLINLWSNPGDLVFSPYAGIGSEGYVALECERRFMGVELKRQYFDVALRNLKYIEGEGQAQTSLFDTEALIA